MQRGVEQHRIDHERPATHLVIGGKLHLGEQLLPASPYCSHALKHGPVFQADVRQTFICPVERHGLRASWRPHPGQLIERALAPRTGVFGRERSTGVPHPLPLDQVTFGLLVQGPGWLTAAIDTHTARARVICLGNRDLQPQRSVLVEHERRLDRKIVHRRAANQLAGMQRELEERRAGHQHNATHRVIGQPWLRPQRQAPREQPTLPVGHRHPRAQQRMCARREASGAEIPGDVASPLKPVALSLKRIRRQVHAPRLTRPEQNPPVDVGAVHPCLRCGSQEGRPPILLATQRPDDPHFPRALQRLLGCFLYTDGEYRVRARLYEGAATPIDQCSHHRCQPHRLTEVAIPVLGV